MKVTITVGTFGWNHDGRYDIVTAGETIDVNDATAQRLLAKGVAVATEPEVEHSEEQSIDDMSSTELRKLGKQYGLEFRVNARKAEMIAAIREHIDDHDDAPAFDATEAIQ